MADDALTATALGKERDLAAALRAAGAVLIGFSGGVDSSYLAVVAREVLGRERVLAVLGRSASVPDEQRAHARQFAYGHDIPLREVETGEVSDPRYAANPVNRCYFCKSVLWETLAPLAAASGATVVDGTNADDLRGHRPGAQAAAEAGVRSPLAECGLTKDEIRRLSRRRGLSTWAQPSSPCLASRIPYGTPVTTGRLAQVERAEAALRALGIEGDLRVRHHGDLARVELDPAVLDDWLAPDRAARVAGALAEAGFPRSSIDLRGYRSGSLNVLKGVTA